MGDIDSLKTSFDAGRFLGELLENLVPIEGLSLSHRVIVDEDGASWVVDQVAFEESFRGRTYISYPLRVAGVAETSLFWKDTRRVLHSGVDFDVLGRVSRSGLQAEWTPVKMIDTFRRVVPSAADEILDAVTQLEQSTKLSAPSSPAGLSELTLRAGLLLNDKLIQHHGVMDQPPSMATLAALSVTDQTLSACMAALLGVANEFYSRHPALARDQDQVGVLREVAWKEAAILSHQPLPVQATSTNTVTGPILELDFIGMYW